MSHPINEDKIEAYQEHVEGGIQHDVDDVKAHDSFTLVKSRFDQLGLWRTLWVFRTASIYCLLVYTGFLCEGFELQAGGSIVANAGFIAQFGSNQAVDGPAVLKLETAWVSTWGAILNVGQMIAFTHIWYINDRFGRRVALLEAWLWLIAGLLFLNFARSSPVWMLGKLCNGIGIGIIQVTAQVYVMEIIPNRIRGGMEAFSAVWQGIGGIIQSVMMYQINKNFPTDYLLALRVIAVPVALIGVCFGVIPESPWFYAKRGNKDGAMKAFKRLYGNVEGYDYEEEYAIIENTIGHEINMVNNAPTFRQVFRGNNLKRTLVVGMMAGAGQLLGTGVISTYNTYFFSLAGFKDPFQAGMILSCTNLTAVIFWTFTTDKFGRRNLVCICETICVLVLFVVGGLYYTGATSGNASGGTAILCLAAIWGWLYSIVVKAYYLFSAELPSAVLRVKTVPITFCVNSILGLITSFAIPYILTALNIRGTFIFGALSIPVCVCMWLFLPETKGRSAAEIDELYEKKVPAWRWSKAVTSAEIEMKAAVAARGAVA